MEFIFDPVKYNFSSRKGQKIQFIVIHDTGNAGKGADAMAHRNYFGGGNRNASAHYFVDDKRIVQIIGDSYSSWHCGDNQGYGRALNGCRNATSIGIELCINRDGDYRQAYKNLVELTKNLMQKFSVPVSRVCRHYDVSRKRCPGTFFSKGLWGDFQGKIFMPIEYKMNLSKTSSFNAEEALKEREVLVAKDPNKNTFIKKRRRKRWHKLKRPMKPIKSKLKR
ncbi:N-acetylmuramoyl-L-alanine amidase [Peptoniphilus sp. oral taxon 375 str. F0436]|nr:N-acetylmuramoyl-L-alanine amidase [Peptoniphilus sp. oral taxon 375 str. F0436]